MKDILIFAFLFISLSYGFVPLSQTSRVISSSYHHVVMKQQRQIPISSTACTFTQKRQQQQFVPLKSSSTDDDDGPDPSILISAKDDLTQQISFVIAFIALGIGTNICIQLWQGPGMTVLGNDFYQQICIQIFPIVFGTIFALVGIAHFVFVTNFARIVPPRGTWGGLWQAPAPLQEQLNISYEEYHSYWTGIAEFIGGIWLLAGGLGYTSTELPAFLLFLLTMGVTPANLYMFTHDATPGGAIPKLSYPYGHIARFIVQCGLLSNFYIMANPP